MTLMMGMEYLWAQDSQQRGESGRKDYRTRRVVSSMSN